MTNYIHSKLFDYAKYSSYSTVQSEKQHNATHLSSENTAVIAVIVMVATIISEKVMTNVVTNTLRCGSNHEGKGCTVLSWL